MELTDRLVVELIESVKQVLKRETSERLREVYLVGDIDKDSARQVIERMRELVNDNTRPITLYLNTAGGNVTDGLAVHDSIREIVSRGCEVTIVVQGMAYSMGSVLLQAASVGRRLAFPHAWIMIHEPAKWAGWQSTTAAQHHLDRLRQMQDPDLPDPGEAVRPAAEADHQGHPPQRLLPRCPQGARVRSDRRDCGKCGGRRHRPGRPVGAITPWATPAGAEHRTRGRGRRRPGGAS